MDNYQLTYFGSIDLDAVNDYYDADLAYQGAIIQLDINFDEQSVARGKLDNIKTFIDNLPRHTAKAAEVVLNDFNANGTAREYIDHHLEDIELTELEELLTGTDKTLPIENQLLSKLQLKRVGFYPEDDAAIFDYSIGSEITQYLIVIKFQLNGEIEYLTMES